MNYRVEIVRPCHEILRVAAKAALEADMRCPTYPARPRPIDDHLVDDFLRVNGRWLLREVERLFRAGLRQRESVTES